MIFGSIAVLPFKKTWLNRSSKRIKFGLPFWQLYFCCIYQFVKIAFWVFNEVKIWNYKGPKWWENVQIVLPARAEVGGMTYIYVTCIFPLPTLFFMEECCFENWVFPNFFFSLLYNLSIGLMIDKHEICWLILWKKCTCTFFVCGSICLLLHYFLLFFMLVAISDRYG